MELISFRKDTAGRLAVGLATTLLLACGFANAQTDGRGAPVNDLCAVIGDVRTSAVEFAELFAAGSEDLDDDGLPDRASLVLVQEVACNENAPLAMAASSLAAYLSNLTLFDAELDTTGLEDFRETIAVLMLTNATTEAAIKTALALANPPITLAADYAQVTCSGGICMPALVRDSAETGAYLDFETQPRAANEPYAADGDLDEDGVTNLAEYDNIQAQGGGLGDFVVAATSPELDGTEPIRSGGGSSGCFIATAAYGTPMATEIDVLRAWRDEALMTHAGGAAFADAYYRLSPAIAGQVSASDTFAQVVRMGLVPVTAATRIGALAFVLVIAVFAGTPIVLQRVTSRGRRPRTGRGR